LARIVQGGHFASDVVWAGGLVYLVAAGAYYFLKMDRSIFLDTSKNQLPIKRNLIVSIIAIAAFALTLLILMADSHHYDRTFSYDVYSKKLELRIEIETGDVELIRSDKVSVNINYIAHGFPWSKVKTKIKSEDFSEHQQVKLKQRESGYFTEVNQTITVYLPDSLEIDVSIKIKEGNLILSDFPGYDEIETDLRKGRVIK